MDARVFRGRAVNSSGIHARPSAASVDHTYALLRILFGLLGCGFLLGLSDLATFWDPGGLVPMAESGWKQLVVQRGWGPLVGRALFFGNLAAFLAMTVGYQSRLTVPLSFVGTSLHSSWNSLPLSGAFESFQAILFCLMWADSGQVWSLDRWRMTAHSHNQATGTASQSLWPLRLIRFQIALIYLATGLWKLTGDQWRQGSALYYVLSNNSYARFPMPPPAYAMSILTMGTYGTVLWEIAFPALVLFRRTRPLALLAGVVLHLGMWVTMELGPFPWVMLAGYVSFLEPGTLKSLVTRILMRSACRPKQQTEVA